MNYSLDCSGFRGRYGQGLTIDNIFFARMRNRLIADEPNLQSNKGNSEQGGLSHLIFLLATAQADIAS